MPAYNHDADNLIEATNDHVTLFHSGDFHCHYGSCSGKYIGRSTLEVQEHFEEEHGFEQVEGTFRRKKDAIRYRTIGLMWECLDCEVYGRYGKLGIALHELRNHTL